MSVSAPGRTTEHGAVEQWRRVLARRWRSGAAAFTVLLLLAAGVVYLTRPIYAADARLKLGEPPPTTGVAGSAGLLGFFRPGGDPFANDEQILSSRSLAEAVVEHAALSAVVRAPRRWHRDSLFTRFTADRTTTKATFVITWAGPDRIAVRQSSPQDSAIAVVPPGAPLTFGGLTVAFRPRRARMPTKITIKTLPFGEAVRRTRKRINVERTQRDANVLDLSFDDTDPGVARAAMEDAVTAFIALRSGLQRTESGTTVDSLAAVAAETRGELERAENAVAAYQKRTGMVAPDAQDEALVRRYADMQGALLRTQGSLRAVTDLLARADTASDRLEAWTRLTADPDLVQNGTIGGLLQSLISLEARRVELATRRTQASRELQALDDQIQTTDRALRALIHAYRDGLIQQEATLTAQLARLDSTLTALPAQAAELTRRQRDARVLTEVLVLTEQRLRQETLREALTYANVQVIDPPALRYRPVWPRKGLGMGVGALLALLFAGLTMAVRDRAGRAVDGA